jgi:hypothetical protein
MPVGGGGVALLASASTIGKLALDGDGALYWTAGAYYQVGSVLRMQNRIDSVLASGQYPTALAVDASFAWFVSKPNGDDGFIRRVPKTGGAVEDMANCKQCFPTRSQWPVDLEVNASVVWWSWNLYGSSNGSSAPTPTAAAGRRWTPPMTRCGARCASTIRRSITSTAAH